MSETWRSHVDRVEGYCQELLNGLHALQQSQTLTDFTIKVKDRTIVCHKVVLSAACPYFAAMLRTGLEETESEVTSLEALDAETVESVVHFFYTGKITLSYNKIKELLETCEYLQCTMLKHLVLQYVLKNITPLNCLSWFKYATGYDIAAIANRSKEVMLTDFTEVCKRKEFLDLPLDSLLEYIEDDNINVENEDQVLLNCLKWLKHDEDARSKDFAIIIKSVILECCTQECLESVCMLYDHVLQLSSTYQKIISALSRKGRPSKAEQVVSPRKSCTVYVPRLAVLCGKTSGWIGNGQAKEFEVDKDVNAKWYTFTSAKSYEFSSICIATNGIIQTGGFYSGIALREARFYDTKMHRWMELPSMEKTRYKHGSLTFGNKVFVFGGSDPTTMEYLSLGMKKWSLSVKPMEHRVMNPIATLLEGCFYVLADSDSNKEVTKNHGILLQIYDVLNDDWKKKVVPSFVESTNGSTTLSFNDAVYFLGGSQKLCTRYQPCLDTWTDLKPCDVLHSYGSAVMSSGNILLLGGETDQMEEYDVKENEWKVLEWKLPQKLSHHFACYMPVPPP